MKPTPLEWLLASRYTFLLWMGLGFYLYSEYGWRWETWTEEQRLVVVVVGMVFAAAWIKAFPTVFFYEREQAVYKRTALSPEERWQRSTVRQTFFLVLLAAALLYFGLQWWKSAPVVQPTSTRTVLSVGGAGVLVTTAYLKVKAWRSGSEAQQAPIVSWCLPVPKQSPTQQQVAANLPDYCKRVMSAGEVQAPASAPPAQPGGQA